MGGLSPQQIYDNFHTHATGSDALQAAQRSAYRLAGDYQDRAVATQKLIDGIRSGWTGQAAEAASQGLAPLAENTLQRGDDLNTAQDLVFRQADSWHTAVAKVQPMPPQPQLQNVITVFSSGQLPQPMLDQIRHYSTVAQSNVDAYGQYVAASRYNASTLPADMPGAASTSAPVAAITPPPTSPSGVTSGGVAGPSVHGGASVSPRSARSTRSHAVSVGATPVSAGPRPSRGSAPPGIVPSVATGGTAPAGSSSTGGGVAGSLGDATGSMSEPSAGPVIDIGVGSGFPGPVTGGWAGSPVGSRSGPNEPNQLDEPNQPDEDRPGGRTPEGPDGGAGAAEGETLAGERAAAVDGRSGEVGAGPMGGRGAAREKDSEHRRKYDYGDDPEETFGVTEMVAPQVIGETDAQRRVRDAQAAPPT
jgi:hypothetical protein